MYVFCVVSVKIENIYAKDITFNLSHTVITLTIHLWCHVEATFRPYLSNK